jgi:hypothetical protein
LGIGRKRLAGTRGKQHYQQQAGKTGDNIHGKSLGQVIINPQLVWIVANERQTRYGKLQTLLVENTLAVSNFAARPALPYNRRTKIRVLLKPCLSSLPSTNNF